ncbi:DUF5602 domain-containing protein [soil metagenome]
MRTPLTSPASRSRSKLATFGLALATAVFYTACSDSNAPQSIVAQGPTTAMASGTGHTYVSLDPDGKPTEVGIRFSESALESLPAGTTMVDYTFALPAEAAATPYTHVVIGWNPLGHPPTVYLAPHLDVHFYQITPAAREAILPSDAQFNAKLAAQPSAAFVPPSYVLTPGGVPRMGAHWVDTTSPEQNGQAFTNTFIFGSYDGAFIFAEPMIATAFLRTHAAVNAALKVPAQYATPGRYPTRYTVTFDATAKEYQIALTGLVAR